MILLLISLPLIIGSYLILSLLKLPDFSIESAYLFGAVSAFFAIGAPLPILLASSMLGGMFVGTIVCTINQFFKLPFLLAAIVTNGIFHGLTQLLLGTSTKSFPSTSTSHELVLYSLIALTIICIISLGLRSQLGFSFAIYGNNPNFFQNHAISGRFCLYSGVMIGHGCAGIAGFLFAHANGFVDLSMNYGIILLCLTALLLGKMFFKTDRPQILVPIIGACFFFCIQSFLLRIGLNLKYFNAFQALLVLLILYLGHKNKQLSLNQLGI